MTAPRFGSLHEGAALEQGAESFMELARAGGARVERIASRAVTNGEWYEQAWPEFVLLVAGAPETGDDDTADFDGTLKILLDELPLKQAVALAVKLTGGSRNVLYERALSLKGGE